MDTRIHFIRLHKDAVMPKHATEGSAGVDLVSVDRLLVEPGERVLVNTGIAVQLKFGTEMQIRPRSGLAIKHGITVLNAPGTIDSDYRGEIKVLLINLGTKLFTIEKGMRIAQAVVAYYAFQNWIEVLQLKSTERGEGGFGSTGVNI